MIDIYVKDIRNALKNQSYFYCEFYRYEGMFFGCLISLIHIMNSMITQWKLFKE
jgi:hypothetical protein